MSNMNLIDSDLKKWVFNCDNKEQLREKAIEFDNQFQEKKEFLEKLFSEILGKEIGKKIDVTIDYKLFGSENFQISIPDFDEETIPNGRNNPTLMFKWENGWKIFIINVQSQEMGESLNLYVELYCRLIKELKNPASTYSMVYTQGDGVRETLASLLKLKTTYEFIAVKAD